MKIKMYPIQNIFSEKIIFSLLLILFQFSIVRAQNTPLSLNGRLKLAGNQLTNEHGKAIQLRGMSSHGLQWFGNCINSSSVNALAKNWGADIVRAAMYVDEGGYLSNRQGMINKVNEMASLAQQNGMYCMIDWHILNPGNPANHVNEAKDFFRQMAQKYAGQKHILYEICNEPNNVAWGTVKWYAEQIIPIIRQYDKEAIIIVGTPTWSGEPMYAANDPITGGWAHNLMYTFHFYAGSHYNQAYMDGVVKRIPIFVTEWGTSNASGNGGNDYNNAQKWMDFFSGKNSAGVKISWCNWSFSDKGESSAALNSGACNSGQWNNTTYDGTWVKNHMLNPADDFGSTNTGGGGGNGGGVTINGTTVIQAENYSDMSDVQKEATTDAGGGLDVGYMNKGSWMSYNKITFPTTGKYTVQYRVASVSGGKLSLDLNAGAIQLGAVNVPATGGWQKWVTISQTITVNAGTYNLGIFAQTGDWNINWFSITSMTPNTIQAENYSDMKDVQKQVTTDAGGGLNVGYINNNSWMKYSKINFPVTGNYTVQYRVASLSGGGKLSMDLNAGAIQLGAINVPSTGGWQNWTTITQIIRVNAGTYDVGIFAQTGGWNINWFTVTPASSPSNARFADADDAEINSDYSAFVPTAYFEVYPNPATSAIDINASFDAAGGAVEIMDATGQIVFTGVYESSMNVSTLPSGIYTLIYTKDSTKRIKRFVKN